MRVTVLTCRSLADVAAIEATVPTGGSRFHHQRYALGDASKYLLAWAADGVAVGHVLVTPESRYDEARGELGRFPEMNALGVAEGYRRRGVARALAAAAEDEAEQMGGDRLGLAVEHENEPAIRLYVALGFERHPTLAPVDVWTWTDDAGVEHEQRDRCTYWTRSIPLS